MNTISFILFVLEVTSSEAFTECYVGDKQIITLRHDVKYFVNRTALAGEMRAVTYICIGEIIDQWSPCRECAPFEEEHQKGVEQMELAKWWATLIAVILVSLVAISGLVQICKHEKC